MIGHQYQILITKHAMSDTASYENSHHTLKKKKKKKKKEGKREEEERKSGHASVLMYSLLLKKPRKLDKTRGTTSASSARQ